MLLQVYLSDKNRLCLNHFVHLFVVGRGAYFADKTTKSHHYTHPSLTDPNLKMFYCLVTLGEMYDISTTGDSYSLSSPPEHYHSIRGLAHPSAVEYIVYQSAQAVPILLITYQA